MPVFAPRPFCRHRGAPYEPTSMTKKPSYPREWLEKVPAVVFASLVRGEFRPLPHPGSGPADGGVQYDVPAEKIPPDLRMANSKVWVRLDERMNIVQVWRREE